MNIDQIAQEVIRLTKTGEHDRIADFLAQFLQVKECKRCSVKFSPKAFNQAFCTTKCRSDFHTAKHGKKFDPALYHLTKKVTSK